MKIPRFGLNRFDSRSVDAFAADVRRAEMLGWDAALEPDSQLRRRDTYVLLAAAARSTERIMLGTLLAVLAGARSQRIPSMVSASLTRADGQATRACATLVRRLGPLGSDKGLYVACALRAAPGTGGRADRVNPGLSASPFPLGVMSGRD